MHLVFIIPSLTAGGAEKIISELANYFAAHNHNVFLIVFSSFKEPPFYYVSPKISLIYLDMLNKSNNNIFYRIINIIKRIIYLRSTIKKINPNLIISFIDITNLITLLASCGLNIPVIVSERTDPKYHNIPALYNYLRFIIYKAAKNIVVQTVSSASYFPDVFKNYIKIIPNVVAKQSTCYKVNKKVKNIVSVGRLVLEKDHQTLFKAFAKLMATKHNYDINLTIYGEGPERVNLEKLIQHLDLQKNIYLAGTIKNIISAIQQADLFVFPSLYEGFPNALCEAMAIGLPVVASNCSGNVDIIQDGINGRLFPVADVESLTNIMQSLINDFKERERLSLNARKVVDTFNEQQIYKLWSELIESVR